MDHTVVFPDARKTLSGKNNPSEQDCRHAEANLIRDVEAGDEAAFYTIVARYQSRVYILAKRLLLDRNDADGIAQEVFTKIYFNAGQYDGCGSVLAWVYGITVDECFRHFRQHRRFWGRTERSNSGGRVLVLGLLSRIPKANRVLLILREIGGYSVDDLARMTGRDQREVSRRLFQARQIMVRTRRSVLRGLLDALAGKLGPAPLNRRREDGNTCI